MITLKLGGFYETKDGSPIRISGVSLRQPPNGAKSPKDLTKVFMGESLSRKNGMREVGVVLYTEDGKIHSTGVPNGKEIVKEFVIPEETPAAPATPPAPLFLVVSRYNYVHTRPGRKTLYACKEDALKRMLPDDVLMEAKVMQEDTPSAPVIPDYIMEAYRIHKGLI